MGVIQKSIGGKTEGGRGEEEERKKKNYIIKKERGKKKKDSNCIIPRTHFHVQRQIPKSVFRDVFVNDVQTVLD